MTLQSSRRGFMAAGLSGGLAALLPSAALAARGGFFDRSDSRLGLQLYAVGSDAARDLDATFARIAAIGYRHLEISSLYRRTPIEFRAAADRAGLAIGAVHLPAGRLALPGSIPFDGDAGRIADTLGTLGARHAVLPLMLLPDTMERRTGETPQVSMQRAVAAAGDSVWKRTAAFLNERAAALKPHGIAVGYHNHNLEFAPVGETTGWDILLRETSPADVSFEVDVGWVAAAGLDPVRVLTAMRGRVRQLHVKDLTADNRPNFALSAKTIDVGSGTLRWDAILRAARRAGATDYYVEQEPPFPIPPLEAVARSFAFLSRLKAG